MTKTPFLKRTPVKILIATLLCVIVIILGMIPVYIALNMYQALFIRILIGAAGVIWAILTIGFILFKFDYFQLWHHWGQEIRHEHMRRVRNQYPEYMALRKKYPTAIHHYEQHILHRKKRISTRQMILDALQVSEEEWAAREEFRVTSRKERKQYQQEHQHI